MKLRHLILRLISFWHKSKRHPLSRRSTQEGVKDFSVEVIDYEKEVVIKAEVPSIEPQDLSIDVYQSLVTIHGTRQKEHIEQEEENALYKLQCDIFSCSFYLPFSVEESQNIQAKLKDGLLVMIVPRSHETSSSPRKINIKVV